MNIVSVCDDNEPMFNSFFLIFFKGFEREEKGAPEERDENF